MFDRQLALDFALHIQPHLNYNQLQQIADALNGSPEAQNCDVKPTNNTQFKHSSAYKPTIPTDNVIEIFVSTDGDDTIGDGTLSNPFQSISKALSHMVLTRVLNQYGIIYLREGIYYVLETIHFKPDHSNIMITPYHNETVTISGGIPLYNCSQWELYKKTSDNKNIYKIDLSNSLTLKLLDKPNFIPGLRVNNTRAIRARYPNANPELDGFGSSLEALYWVPPIPPLKPAEQYKPLYPMRNESATYEFMYYQLGIGGICNQFDPPAGYWCGTETEGGGASTYSIPHGLAYNKTILPHAPYNNINGGIISTWRPAHWASWFFEIGGYDSDGMVMNFSRGGFQGARGANTGAEFYIENIFEELDYENEWYYDMDTMTLYYYNNLTNNMVPQCEMFEVTNKKILINMEGNQTNPVKNIVIDNIIFKDTAYTYMDNHGMPSGGDFTQARKAAITLKGTENILINNNLFTRLDGNGIILNGYNRNVTILNNEFVWQGDTCILLWGDTEGITFVDSNETMGYDGTAGNQPRFTNIVGNLAHEIGIWEKQSSLVFQAKSCQNNIERNIVYNQPRAAIEFNDGFGGESKVSYNLLFNCVRESGDHGCFNSWDRQVYLTTVRNGTASPIKGFDEIDHNFIIGNYDTQDCIDNDDGSCYYKQYNNFLIYGPNGYDSNSQMYICIYNILDE